MAPTLHRTSENIRGSIRPCGSRPDFCKFFTSCFCTTAWCCHDAMRVPTTRRRQDASSSSGRRVPTTPPSIVGRGVLTKSPARCWRPSVRLERARRAPDQVCCVVLCYGGGRARARLRAGVGRVEPRRVGLPHRYAPGWGGLQPWAVACVSYFFALPMSPRHKPRTQAQPY